MLHGLCCMHRRSTSAAELCAPLPATSAQDRAHAHTRAADLRLCDDVLQQPHGDLHELRAVLLVLRATVRKRERAQSVHATTNKQGK
jgi:hypothetical protein